MKRGLFISFEGIEGCGKSTQVMRLASWLSHQNLPHVATREPGGTPLGEEIRKALLTEPSAQMDSRAELFLYLASRAEHVRKVIEPALRNGKFVICDRFSDATMAYQHFGRGLARSYVRQAIRYAEKGTRPDLTLLLDIPPEEGLARVRGRGMSDRMDNEDIQFHDRIRRGYLKIAESEPRRFHIIDGRQDLDSVATTVQKVVAAFIRNRVKA